MLFRSYLAGFVACEDCDGKGYWLGEAHLTSEHFVRCGECRNGDVGIELEGDKAEDAYEAWAASDTDRYEIEAGSPGGAYASASAVGWAAFLPVAAAFSAKHPHTVVNNVDRADVGTNGIDDWQAEMIQVAAMRLEFTAEKTEVAA